jgi:hypothetical protein
MIRSGCRFQARALLLCGLSLAVALGCQAALAGSSRVELKDGSVLTGDLVGYAGGIYTLRSPTLGEVRLEEPKVVSVRPGATGDSAGVDASGGLGGLLVPPALAGQVQSTRQRLISDPAVFGMIMALQNDPAVRAVLSDPAFLSLITSGNLQAIQGSPGFQELLQHPALRAILEQVR